MHPICFEIGGLQVHWFGVMMALGFLAGLLNWTWLGRRGGRDFNYCSDLLFWVMVAGVLGARLAYVLANLADFLAEPATIFRIDQGGLIYYGGLLGAIAAMLVFARKKQESAWSVFDLVVTSVPLAHAFGRVGCVLNGCCFGRLHENWPAIRYPSGSLAWWQHLHMDMIDRSALQSMPVHPVQLYESICNLLIYVLLVLVYRRHRRAGIVAATYLMVYPVVRFLLEFLRGDERLRYGTPLSVAQYMSILLFACGCAIMVRITRQSR